jgi:integrase
MLTDAVLKRRAKPGDSPHKVSDGHGLYLYVPVTGRPRWRYDYRHDGRRKTVSLGIYDDVTLSMARERLVAARQAVAAGKDPIRERRLVKAEQAGEVTFDQLAEEWLSKRLRDLAPATAKKKHWFRALVKPVIGNQAVRTLTPMDVLPLVKRLEHQRETARRALQFVGQVLRYGVATGRATRDVTADIEGAIAPAAVQHRPALTDPAAVGGLLRAIAAMDTPQLRTGLQLLALTFVRPGELRQAQWSEIDTAAAIWRIPSERTKQREAHLVPLSRQALAAFEQLREIGRGSDFVLPSPRTIKRPLSEVAFIAGLARIGYAGQHSPHGFRALARTLLDERLQESPDAIEAQLGHVTRGALRDTYNRSRYLAQRTAMMQRWADYLDSLGAATATPQATQTVP